MALLYHAKSMDSTVAKPDVGRPLLTAALVMIPIAYQSPDPPIPY